MHSFKGYQAHMDIFECPVWTAFVVLPTHSLFVVRYLFNFHSRIPKNRKTSRSWDCRNRTRDNPDISRVFYHWIKSQYSDRYEIWTRATTVKGWCLTARLTDHNRHKTVSNMFFVLFLALSGLQHFTGNSMLPCKPISMVLLRIKLLQSNRQASYFSQNIDRLQADSIIWPNRWVRICTSHKPCTVHIGGNRTHRTSTMSF